MARLDAGLRFDAGVRLDSSNPAPTVMAQNLISQTMTDAQRDAMLADLTAFDTKYMAFKCPLDPGQIRRLAKLGPSDLGLLKMALAYAQQNPNNIPAMISTAELDKDIKLVEQLIAVDTATQQRANNTRCSIIAGMSDGFNTSLSIYAIAQAQGRTPDNSAFLDAFGERFKKGPAEPPAPTP
jgi:hypothetical protein